MRPNNANGEVLPDIIWFLIFHHVRGAKSVTQTPLDNIQSFRRSPNDAIGLEVLQISSIFGE